MKQYLDLLSDIRHNGRARRDRTGIGTLGCFGRQLRFDLSAGFPLVTTKRVHFKSVVHELLWFLAGSTNVADLNRHGVTIWDEWADADGELGPIYGHQYRAWGTPDGRAIDQLSAVVEEIRRFPESRRHLVSAWNVADLEEMAIPPCHVLFQFHVGGDRLSCQTYIRSSDTYLGLPFNIASYALLTMMVANVTDYEPGDLVVSLGDVHLYLNHLDQADEQLTRKPYPLPRIRFKRALDSLYDFRYEDIELVDYRHHAAIHADVAV